MTQKDVARFGPSMTYFLFIKMSELWSFKDWYEMTTFWRFSSPGKFLP